MENRFRELNVIETMLIRSENNYHSPDFCEVYSYNLLKIEYFSILEDLASQRGFTKVSELFKGKRNDISKGLAEYGK